MVIGSVITLIGAIVQASAQLKRDLIAGRVVLGIGTVMLGPAAQSYAVGKCLGGSFLKIMTTNLYYSYNSSQKWHILLIEV